MNGEIDEAGRLFGQGNGGPAGRRAAAAFAFTGAVPTTWPFSTIRCASSPRACAPSVSVRNPKIVQRHMQDGGLATQLDRYRQLADAPAPKWH